MRRSGKEPKPHLQATVRAQYHKPFQAKGHPICEKPQRTAYIHCD
ncbi:hypothetical protein EV213_10278 [Aureibacillus halotolerans]|uniref:Uncharacterized protein n=1 Tax=Aureibacillus halotolerans TaxID=1508390 RepID=A0A4R6U6B4_9BACI|nr:hypothetical protein EV213_10278 [Aureibacillus halotolerans]